MHSYANKNVGDVNYPPLNHLWLQRVHFISNKMSLFRRKTSLPTLRSCPVCSLRISPSAPLLLELLNGVRERSIPLRLGRRRAPVAAAVAPRWDWSLRSHFLSNQTAVSGREPTRASLQVCAWLRPMIANRFLVTSNGDVRHRLCFLFAVEANDGCG